jgi:quinoprotein glucose dehydrogenase
MVRPPAQEFEMAAAATRPPWRHRPFVFASLIMLIGLYLLVGGAWLIALGGSWWYAITGAVLIASGILLWLGDRRGSWLYGLMLVYTIIWALWESGPHPWALAPRILGPAILGIWLLLPWTQRGLVQQGAAERLGLRHAHVPPGAVAAGLAVVVVGATLLHAGRPKAQDGQPAHEATPATNPSAASNGEWRNYGNTLQGSRYSPVAQITPANVDELKPAWTFRTGDLPGPKEKAPREFTFEATPLMVNGTVYLCTPHNQVVALDAETGQQKWRFNSQTDPSQAFVIACRGVSYFEKTAGPSGEPCAHRIVGGTIDARLYEVDADTGRPCTDFGQGGFVNLLEGMGPVKPGFSYQTSPPTVADGKIILGGWINDNMSTNEPSGVIRAFDADTGKLAWAWDMGAPGRTGAPGPGEQYTRDTPNAWAPFAADPQLGLVYVPTGNAPPDWYGAKRRPFDDKYSSSVVALDLNTGRPRWSFQTTHHDVWDYDVPSQPVLVDLPTPGGGVEPAVVQSTKRGEIFVLDRRDGHPIVPVREQPVPQNGPPGEHMSPTQPFSGISLLPAKLEEKDMWGATPLDQLACRIMFKESRYDGVFTPWAVGQPMIVFPGALGVVDWGGTAVDERRKVLVVNSSAVPYRDEMLPRSKGPEQAQGEWLQSPPPGQPKADYAWSPMIGEPYVAHIQGFMSPIKMPCTQPPWGFMQAIDLTSGKILWRHPIGTAQDSGPMGIKSHLPIPMGVPNIGGTMVTAGGLAFNGSTLDQYLRAYDTKTGKEVWKARLPAGGQATPMTYVSPVSGRQFVVICAGGHGGLGTTTGDYVMAFALPRRT